MCLHLKRQIFRVLGATGLLWLVLRARNSSDSVTCQCAAPGTSQLHSRENPSFPPPLGPPLAPGSPQVQEDPGEMRIGPGAQSPLGASPPGACVTGRCVPLSIKTRLVQSPETGTAATYQPSVWSSLSAWLGSDAQEKAGYRRGLSLGYLPVCKAISRAPWPSPASIHSLSCIHSPD